MNAKPNPGKHPVGGAKPQPWGAFATAMAESIRRLTRDLAVANPGQAALAALAFQTNQAITRQVSMSYSLAILARNHAQSLVDAGEHHLPEGPLREALTAPARLQVGLAESAAEAATDFGRRYGHLAFAFAR